MSIEDTSGSIPNIAQIEETIKRIGSYVRQTPTWEWNSGVKSKIFGDDAKISLKLELLQFGGSFKARGAVNNLLNLNPEQRAKGVTAVSAGNHAIAVAYASSVCESTAKVVMPKSANPMRIEKCIAMGAEVVLKDDVHQAFAEVRRIQEEEGRFFVHPFEGETTVLGPATLGYELMQQVPNLDAVVVPIGGGGLCAGIATAVKLINPNCKVYGVEPEGANTMTLSLKSGKPESIDAVKTIADSLGAPYAAPYSFSLCQKYVDEVVLISDQEMCDAMSILFHDLKLAVEPAGASATAALSGPLRQKLAGRHVALIVCGANIDLQSFNRYTSQATEVSL